MTIAEFTSEMLAELRKEFYGGATEKQFFQDKSLLLEAIAYPADWLKRHGSQEVASKYRQILRTVIKAIKTKGNRAVVRSVGLYFLKCVQEHMAHHGDQYYEESKTLRALVGPVRRTIRETEAINDTETLAETHRVLTVRSGRKRRPSPKQRELFAS